MVNRTTRQFRKWSLIATAGLWLTALGSAVTEILTQIQFFLLLSWALILLGILSLALYMITVSIEDDDDPHCL